VEQVLDSGHMAIIGHQMLGALSVVRGSLETLRSDGRWISGVDRRLLENAIERNLLRAETVARRMVRGESDCSSEA